MAPYLTGVFGNASSVHSFGREARAALEVSRERIATLLNARVDEVFFTSGGTEGDNYALKGVARANAGRGKNHIIVSAIEHHAVLHPAESLKGEGLKVDFVPVSGHGLVDPDEVLRFVTPETCLISIMHANNEVGTIQPIRDIARLGRDRGILVHSDAVQSVGKLRVDFQEMGVDILSISAHKFYGPKGIGAIVIRRGTEILPLIEGGAQESNRRAGTENVALAVGFARALELAVASLDSESTRLEILRSYLRKQLADRFDGVMFNEHPDLHLPHILSISFDSSRGDVDGEALIMGMDLRGVAVTSGSACTSGSLQPSHVLLAMARDAKTAKATIRFSMGRSTTKEELDYALDALDEVLKTMENRNVLSH
jgi:cysteine desulfurase